MPPEPNSTPEPSPEAPEDPVATELAPLGDNLLWVAHFSNKTKNWSVYDPSGTFSPEMLPLAGQDVPDASEIDEISGLVSRQIYWVMLSEAQGAVLAGVSRSFPADLSAVVW